MPHAALDFAPNNAGPDPRFDFELSQAIEQPS
jgi:hypothetical protein